jgi:hypothetical protein
MQMIDDLRKDERAGAIEAAGRRRREATDRRIGSSWYCWYGIDARDRESEM